MREFGVWVGQGVVGGIQCLVSALGCDSLLFIQQYLYRVVANEMMSPYGEQTFQNIEIS